MANLLPSFSFSLIPLNHHKSETKCSFIQIKHHNHFLSKNIQDLIIPFSHNHTSKLFATSSRLSIEETEQKLIPFTQSEDFKTALSYLFRTEIGEGLVKVYVKKKTDCFFVYIEVSSLELSNVEGETLVLCWGLYRDDSSSVGDGKGMNVSPFVEHSVGKFSVELEFDVEQVPLYLSFLLRFSGLEIRTHLNRNFCVPVGFLRGRPDPLGISFSRDGTINFAVFSRNAESVVLCLYDDDDDSGVEKPALEIDLDPYVNRSGDIWHIGFESAGNFVSYGYRFRGANRNNSFAEGVVLDPYARIVGNSFQNGIGSAKNLGFLRKEPAFDWSDDYHPNLEMEKLVVYRLNVKRFTEHESSQLSGDLAGKFSGLAKKLQHFKDLGVNAVLLEPVFTFDEKKGPYFPCHFFSPMNLYGPSGDPVYTVNSMKEMVKTMHANGIEVIMEVVFTNTAETGALQGIDDLSYYANGIGGLKVHSALNCNYPIMQNLILDSLRHWVTEFHIDGFSFVNASHLLRGFHGEYLSRPPLVEAIAFDPILWKTKIIADCWNPNDMEPKETRFPHWMRWAEINTNFRNDVRNFLRGESLLSNLATRLCGSGDLYSDGRGPSFSFNYIAGNFGLSLVDLVSFSSADLALELSWNCGEEGPTNNTAVLERRLKQIRNFLFILFVSLGVPILNMGDECGHSSGGSPACGDTKPFNWAALKTGFGKQTTQFISFLTSLRTRRSDLLQSRSFLKEENIEWRGIDKAPPRWEDTSCKFLAMTLKTEQNELQESSVSSDILGDLFIAFNADDHPETVVLPLLPEGMSWYRLVDTALPFPGFFLTNGDFVPPEQISGLSTYEMKSYSCTLFEANNSKNKREETQELHLQKEQK